MITFAPMNQQEYNIYVKEGCEIKTSQMLDALGIELRLPFKSVEIEGIQHLALSQNGIIYACIEPGSKERILSLPYVIDIALTKND